MPHTQSGFEVQVGDTVMVLMIVKEVIQGEDYCNARLETVYPMYPSKEKNTIWLNTGQITQVTERRDKDGIKVIER
jgi:hypothetical protein